LASELRWILLAIGLPVLAAIWWWTSRRSRQGTDSPELREVAQPAERVVEVVHPVIREEPGDWGVPPFEPLSIRTADFDNLHDMDHPPMTAHAEPFTEQGTVGEPEEYEVELVLPRTPTQPEASMQARTATAARAQVPSVSASAPALSETGTTGNRPQLPNAAETQRIVTLRVCALDETRWSGVTLLAALNDHGLAHGRYQVFHRKHSDGRTLFCAASLVEPGTFNLAQMPSEEYRGLTLFAVLPGPVDAVQTVDALIDTADALAKTLNGEIQDSKGRPLTPEAADALRDDVERFQIMLAMN
jgi:cell division protein ZipA